MHVRSVLVSLLAGVVVFGLVTIVVTEALRAYVWPSVMVGLLVGALAGVLAAALVWHHGRSGTERGDRSDA